MSTLTYLWVGLHQVGNSGAYQWLYNQRYAGNRGIMDWGPDEPNSNTTLNTDSYADDCGAYRMGFGADDRNCNYKYGYVCQIWLQ